MITVEHSGNFENITRFLNKMTKRDAMSILHKYGKRGVDLLRDATPIDTGTTANSWSYEVVNDNGQYKIYWNNDNENNGVHIAIILQYGHATKNGGYVEGIDYINPVMKEVFEDMAEELWREVVDA
jgi:hypothetical protein